MPKDKTKWPKKAPGLTMEQAKILDDWTKYWFEINRNKFSHVVDFGHCFVTQHSRKGFLRSLEIGAGLGDQLDYEDLTDEQMSNYVSVELRENMAGVMQKRWPKTKTLIADCQEHIPFPDAYFDRIIAIHVLEHLANLPALLSEADRLLSRHGQFLVVIPCEGGFGYTLGRRFTSKRIFEKRYKQAYAPFIRADHVNNAKEVLIELRETFLVEEVSWYPLRIPSIHSNLCIGLVLKPLSR